MAKRTCEICGRPTDEADFSKSYKHRCKECVAREARKARAAKTGAEGNTEYIRIPGTCLDDAPNWEQRRYEIAKDIFTRCLSHEDGDVRAFCNREIEMTATDCVQQADALINALKNERP